MHAYVETDLWKPEGKKQLGIATFKWKFAFKMDLKEAAWVSEEG